MAAIFGIADDLSGAAEIAGIARASGLSAEVQRGSPTATQAAFVAVDTDSRGLSPEAAGDRVGQICRQAVAQQPAWIFKKVDSVLRGNVGVEIEAVLSATGAARALLIPCNPSRGRGILAGRYTIGGVPLDQTVFATDPDHPRRSADIGTLLSGARYCDVHSLSRKSPLASHGICVPDAENLADLRLRASEADDQTLLAGAADFFRAILEARGNLFGLSAAADALPIAAPVLIACGSKAAWPIRREECRQAGLPVATLDQSLATGESAPALLLGIGDTVRMAPAGAVSLLAEAVAARMRQRPTATLLAEGGATAAAIAARLGWNHFDVAAAAPEGIGILRPRTAGALLFVIKPGSYAWPASVWDALRRGAPSG